MFIRKLDECEEFIAGDNTILRELLHADKSDEDFRYSLAHAVVKPGDVSAPHTLSVSEVYYILEGEGKMTIGDETELVGPGCVISIPPNATQFIENTGDIDLKFLCIVDPAWCPDHEVILK
ncbi:MAG: cupin domain-containing protein [Candidatus Kerfeldbacteria bacterium]